MNQRGFTLLETLLYITLVTILWTGAFQTAIKLSQDEYRDHLPHDISEDLSFVDAKIGWALSQWDRDTTTLQPQTGSAPTLSLHTTSGMTIALCRLNGRILLYQGEHAHPFCGDTGYTPLTNAHLVAETLNIEHAEDHSIPFLTITITLNHTTTTIHYSLL